MGRCSRRIGEPLSIADISDNRLLYSVPTLVLSNGCDQLDYARRRVFFEGFIISEEWVGRIADKEVYVPGLVIGFDLVLDIVGKMLETRVRDQSIGIGGY
jgi:hypothetical protein